MAKVTEADASLECTCPATSEYDPPCPRHGVVGIGVTPANAYFMGPSNKLGRANVAYPPANRPGIAALGASDHAELRRILGARDGEGTLEAARAVMNALADIREAEERWPGVFSSDDDAPSKAESALLAIGVALVDLRDRVQVAR